MDQTRKQRLKALIKSSFEDSQQKFADETGISKGRVSQLLDEDKPFGERAAKGLVERINKAGVQLPDGYFESASAASAGIAQAQERPQISLEDALDAIKAEVERAKSSATVHIDHAWPFSDITREQWGSLTPDQQAAVQSVIKGMLGVHSASSGGSGSGSEKRHAA